MSINQTTPPSQTQLPYQYDSITLSLQQPAPLQPAPTFYPNESQFADPIAYIRSIAHIGQRTGQTPKQRQTVKLKRREVAYGTTRREAMHECVDYYTSKVCICKIVPPKSWFSPLQLNRETFTFKSKVQRLDMLIKRGSGGDSGMNDAAADDPCVNDQPSNSPIDMTDTAAAVGDGPSTPNRRKSKRADTNGNSLKRKSNNLTKQASSIRRAKRAKQDQLKSGIDVYSNTICQLCEGYDHDDKVLLCDTCDKGQTHQQKRFHTHCLSPPLTSIPTSDWHCPECLAIKMNTFGFDKGRSFTLNQYQLHDQRFTQQWFNKQRANSTTTTTTPDMIDINSNELPPSNSATSSIQSTSNSDTPFIRPTAAEISSAFWNILEHPTGPVSVDYGSDLDTERLGSGFPKTGPVASQSFNCNNLALSKGSMINWQDDSIISGVTIPWLYVGMIFSTFCWHVEDHWLYSINYVHEGAPKQWYGVPATSASAFELKMREALPNLFALQPDLLFQLVTMLNPAKLATSDGTATTRDPSVYYLLQEAGTFVITFPRSFHAGLNHGFNVAESVNFGGIEWLPYGTKCIERYRFFRRPPIFNHEQLLMKLTESVIQAFETITKQQITKKYQLKSKEAQKMFNSSKNRSNSTDSASKISAAQQNRSTSLASMNDVWYFAAWLLEQLKQLFTREKASRNVLFSGGTLRGQIWQNETKRPLIVDSKNGRFVTHPIGTIVTAPWRANPKFHSKVPTNPDDLIWYPGKIIGWDGLTGLYSVRYTQDNEVDSHVLPEHIKFISPAPSAVNDKEENDWLDFQACIDSETNAEGERPNNRQTNSSTTTSSGGMKAKKSAVDFSPTSSSNTTYCVICRHALYLSCVRCNCSPLKSVCLGHAQELCQCAGESKTIHFRYTNWQMENILAAIEHIVNYRLEATKNPVVSLQMTESATHISRRPNRTSTYDVHEGTIISESASSADDFQPFVPPSPIIPVSGSEVTNGLRTKYPLSFSANFIHLDRDEDEIATDHLLEPNSAADQPTLLPILVGSGSSSITASLVASPDAYLNDHEQSTRVLSSIIRESRRIINESDDYVLAVGLRDESLAKTDAALQQREAAQPITPTPSTSTIPPPPKSIHHSTLRSATRFSPTKQSTPSIQTERANELARQRLREEAMSWLATYSPWRTRAEEAKKKYIEDCKLLAIKVKTEPTRSTPISKPNDNGAASTPINTKEGITFKSEEDVTMTDAPTVTFTTGGQLSNTTPSTLPTRSNSSEAVAAGPATSSNPPISIQCYSFITSLELEKALYDGSKYLVHGDDESMMDVYELYGILLSWSQLSQRLPGRLCGLIHSATNLKSRVTKMTTTIGSAVRPLYQLVDSKEDMPTRLPKSNGIEPMQATILLEQCQLSPVHITCICGAHAVSSTTTQQTPSSPFTTASHLSDLSNWIHQFPTLLENCRRHGSQAPDLLRQLEQPSFQQSASTTDKATLVTALLPLLNRLYEMCATLADVAAIPFKESAKQRLLTTINGIVDKLKQFVRDRNKPHPPQPQRQQQPHAQSSPFGLPVDPFKLATPHTTYPKPVQTTNAHPTPSPIPSTVAASPITPSSSASPTSLIPILPVGPNAPLKWLTSVNSLLLPRLPHSTAAPPLLVVLYEALLEGKKLFPSLAHRMEFRTNLDEISSIPIESTGSPEFVGITDLDQLRATIAQLTHWCWNGYWWLMQCRRLLPPTNPLTHLTPIEVKAYISTQDLNSFPVPPKLLDWAYQSHPTNSPVTPATRVILPWCSLHVEHAQLSFAFEYVKQRDPSLVVPKPGKCCALWLLTAPILTQMTIPEATTLLYEVQQIAQLQPKICSLLPPMPWTTIKLPPRSTRTFIPDAPFDNIDYRQQLMTRNVTIAQLRSVLIESNSIGLVETESYVLMYHLKVVDEWKSHLPKTLIKAQTAYRQYYGRRATIDPSGQSEIESIVSELEQIIRQSNAYGVRCEDIVLAFQLWDQGQAILKAIQQAAAKRSAALPKPLNPLTPLAPSPVAAAALSVSTMPPVLPPEIDIGALVQHLLSQSIPMPARGSTQPAKNNKPNGTNQTTPTPTASPPSANPSAKPSVNDHAMNESGALSDSDVERKGGDGDGDDEDEDLPDLMDAPAQSSSSSTDPPPNVSGGRAARIHTIGEMLDRLQYAEDNQLILNSLTEVMEKETYLGFGLVTLGVYRKHWKRANFAGCDLSLFRSVPYKLVEKLIESSPEQRARMLAKSTSTPIAAPGRASRKSSNVYYAYYGVGDGYDEEDEHALMDEDDDRDDTNYHLTNNNRSTASRTKTSRPMELDDGLGQQPVEPVTPLIFPEPPAEPPQDSVYSANSKARKELLQYVKDAGFFNPTGLLPCRGMGDMYRSIDVTRKTAACVQIQHAFQTNFEWTKKFLSICYSNQRTILNSKGTKTNQQTEQKTSEETTNSATIRPTVTSLYSSHTTTSTPASAANSAPPSQPPAAIPLNDPMEIDESLSPAVNKLAHQPTSMDTNSSTPPVTSTSVSAAPTPTPVTNPKQPDNPDIN